MDARRTGFTQRHTPKAQLHAARTALALGVFLASASDPALAAAPSAASPAPSAQDQIKKVEERSDRVSAALAARLQGQRVRVADETTATTLTYVNPNGTVTLEASSSPVRVKRGDSWVAIDTTLIAENGVLKPRAALSDVEFSAGGSGKPLVLLKSSEKQSYSLTWPGALPQPRIEGNKATYPDAAGPGADLVVAALPDGFRHDLVLRERPADAVEFEIPVETRGLKLGESGDGGLNLLDRKGKMVASAPEPVMYEASAHAQAAPSAAPTDKIGKIDTRIVDKDGRQALVLRPDPAYLGDPDTTFPVIVDPTITLNVQAERTILEQCTDGTELSHTLTGGQEVGVIDGSFWEYDGCGNNGGNDTPARALLKFDTSSLAGQQVVDARLDTALTAVGYNGQPNCPTGRALRVRRMTGAWTPSTVKWSTQPATTAEGEVVPLPPAACVDDPNVTEHPWNFQITKIAQAWAGGAAGHGLQLSLHDERTDAGTFYWKFANVKLVITTGGTPWTENLRTAPVVGNSGAFYTNTVTPTLFAGVRDNDGGLLKSEFEMEHDPADTAHGSGLIWSGAVEGVQAGEFAKAVVPAGKLADGWKVRWRARASDGVFSSEWSPWQAVTVDTRPPTLTSGNTGCSHPAGTWKPRDWNGPSKCFMGSGDTDLAGFQWGLDDPTTSDWKPIKGGDFGGSLEIPLDSAGEGWHTVYIRARDKAHNTSPLWSMSFGIGTGGIVADKHKSRTQRAVPLIGAAAPEWTQVTYEYRASADPSPWDLEVWNPIPPSDVTAPGSATPIGSWPQTRTDTSQDFAELSWDLAKTLRDTQYADGGVKIRACFSKDGASPKCTPSVITMLDRTAFGTSYATADVGPGTLALQTGDFSIKTTDVSMFGVDVSRATTTLDPTAARHDQQIAENKLFGPGWRGGFPTAPSWVSEFSPTSSGNSGTIQLVGPSGETMTYVKKGDYYVGIGDAADGSAISKDSNNDRLIVQDKKGVKTTYVVVNGNWVVSRVETSGAGVVISYSRDAQGRVTRVLSAPAAGVTCEPALAPGCRALDLTYSTATTATGVGSGWGEYIGQAQKISFTGFDPESSAMKTTVLVSYTYDSTGRMREVTDPRTGMKTTYYYTAEGRVNQITPPGLAPWRMDYDAQGRLAHVQREGGEIDPTYAVAYDVPIGGAGAPLDLTSAQTSSWGQAADLPHVGTAVFPASRIPVRGVGGVYRPAAEDWKYGALTYMDINGRAVNRAEFGAGSWQVSTSRYDDKGNVTWELTPGNRAQALSPSIDTDPYVAAQSSSAARADLLATVSQYTTDSDLLSVEGSMRTVALADKALTSARERTSHTYDEGKPSTAVDYHMVTKTVVEPVVPDGSTQPGALDKKTTLLGYDPIKSGDPSGWDLRKSTSMSTVMGGQANIVRRVRYDQTGREIEQRMPASSGNDTGTTLTRYYTAGAHPADPSCGNKPEWSGWICRIGPAAQSASGKQVATNTHTYTYYGNLASSTSATSSVSRMSVNTYDGAGRLIKSRLDVSAGPENGTPIPETIITYDPVSGLEKQKSAGNDKVVIDYDSFGRAISYTDATNNVATATYTIDNRVATTNDGKGIITFSYNGLDAKGLEERRGLLTKMEVSGVGSFGGAYDAQKGLIHQTYPNGLVGTSRFDSTGRQTSLKYSKDGTPWLQFSVTPDVNSRVSSQSSPAGSQSYSYDAADRLVSVQDRAGGCVTRMYGFDSNSNRTTLSSYSADSAGQCSTSTTAQTQTYSYDTADRITNTGYAYDEWGRTTRVPAAHVAGSGDLSVGYFANGLVASLSQGGESSSFALDPSGRVKSTTRTGGSKPGTVTNHYAGSEDSPAWITEADGTWTRNILGFSGLSAMQMSTGQSVVLLSNMHGDIVAQVENSVSVTGVLKYSESAEYGVRRVAGEPDRYGWLGSKQRSGDATAGMILMGVRVYNPMTGRFLQTDPIPGGSANAYEYCSGDPVNRVDLAGLSDTPSWGAGKPQLVDHIVRTSKTFAKRADGYWNDEDIHERILSKIPFVGDEIKSVEITDYYYVRTEVFTYKQSRSVYRCDGRVQIMACDVLTRKKELITQVRYGTQNAFYRYTKRVTIVYFRNGRHWMDDTGWRLAESRKSGVSWGAWH
ncbi:DNRLRE domain-containing protein [Nonomuraea typhae]|uniref:DNRLRE domain-containing protein n=1 Tax=Nonomuraea typhae TaxID=2603600 RepID=UPI0012F84476|nr:DNRLRE domain-containing protein [Nonomuraea typhae]